MGLQTLNEAAESDAAHMLRQCCTSERWISRMTAARPYSSGEDLRKAADENWKGLYAEDYLQAFEGHPKIGDVSSLQDKYANTKELAAGEQSAVNVASDAVIQRLADGNTAYEEKFGFIFIVCATGKSAQEMSDLLQARLLNDRKAELTNAAEEQRKIFQLRLTKMLESDA
ncbi:MAG: 2-oxo-4-hydroxy-4-carboxy-5-ureidoimidazoline decarboxylase [Pseudomonadales bacterium]